MFVNQDVAAILAEYSHMISKKLLKRENRINSRTD